MAIEKTFLPLKTHHMALEQDKKTNICTIYAVEETGAKHKIHSNVPFSDSINLCLEYNKILQERIKKCS